MAEDKKSFIMYADFIHAFEVLDDDEAGRLIKHILRYVNDLNPESPDKITKVSFEPIKQQLKRDLKEWEVIRDDRSKSGRLGNLKRWHKDLYKKVINKEITVEQAEFIAKSRKVSHPDNTQSQPFANIAVTDTVNVNVIESTAHPLVNSNFNRQPNIPTFDNVLEVFKRNGATKEMAESFFGKYEGTGWFLNGSPITKWPSLAQKFIINWQKNDELKTKKEHIYTNTAPPLKYYNPNDV